MEPTTFADVAGMVAWFGALGVIVAALNYAALRVVRADEVPVYVRGRILWWGAHNAAFLLVSLMLMAAGLAVFVAA